jgi:dihydrofolate synthase/folylpolyglutamate synthase
VEAVLKLLPRQANYYFTQAHIPRALDAKTLQMKASQFSLDGNDFQDVNEAIRQALKNASRNDLIIICGSIFLVAEVDRRSVGFIGDKP